MGDLLGQNINQGKRPHLTATAWTAPGSPGGRRSTESLTPSWRSSLRACIVSNTTRILFRVKGGTTNYAHAAGVLHSCPRQTRTGDYLETKACL